MNQNKIPQLRICLTERCDKKCFYCRPTGEAIHITDKVTELDFNKLISIIKVAVEKGITVVRLTGGEPMLYPNIYKLICTIKQIEGIREVSLVTRSKNLNSEAEKLKNAGLDSITISIDSLNKDVLKKITGIDLLDDIILGTKKCFQVGLPVKINTVIMRGINDSEDSINEFIEFICQFHTITWKLLDYMVLPNQTKQLSNTSYFVNLNEVKSLLLKSAKSVGTKFSTQAGGLGSPMNNIKVKEGVTVQIKDSTIGSHYFKECEQCLFFPCQDAIMALRLTSNGYLQKCLYRNDNLIDLNPILDNNQLLENSIEEALTFYKQSRFIANAWKPTLTN